MPTPKTWTDRAGGVLLDERNKRYLGMTDKPTGSSGDLPATAAGRARCRRCGQYPDPVTGECPGTAGPLTAADRVHDLVSALAYALARADLPGPMDTSRDYAERLAPLVEQSGYQAAADPSGLRTAAIKACEEHYEREHVNTIPPCAGAMQDAEWWAAALAATPPASGPLTSGSNEPEGLDVERLARAIAGFRVIDGEHEGDFVHLVYDPSATADKAYHLADPLEFAQAIAAEYTRLANEEGEA